MLAGKSAAAAKEQVARTTDVGLPIMQVRFITFLITLIVFVGDCYSMIGPTLQLAAETVASRLRRPVKILLDFLALSPAAAQSQQRSQPLQQTRRGQDGLKTAA